MYFWILAWQYLSKLIFQYSNVTVSKIYGSQQAATCSPVLKHCLLVYFGVVRYLYMRSHKPERSRAEQIAAEVHYVCYFG